MKLLTMPNLPISRRWRPAALLAVTLLGGVVFLALRRPRALVYPAMHPSEIYSPDASVGPLYAPFQLAIDPMERLLLVNFEQDLDELYRGFEPQVFDDETHGQGLIVIGWRLDGKVDVFHQPGLRLDPATYAIAGGGLNELVERPLEGAYFEVTETGVDAALAFEDILGRPVTITVHERSARPRKPFGLLAPMGDAATAPSALPLVLLRDFYFVRQADTEVAITIDGRAHQPDKLPIPMDNARMYFLRYSSDPLIAMLNPAHAGPLAPLERSGAHEAREGETRYDLIEQHGQPAITSMRASLRGHEVMVRFTPPLPNLSALADGAQANGGFQISADPVVGTVTGEYTITRRGEQVLLSATPSGGWKPNESKLSANLIYRAVSAFTEWPKSYRWAANFDLATARLQAGWERTTNRHE